VKHDHETNAFPVEAVPIARPRGL